MKKGTCWKRHEYVKEEIKSDFYVDKYKVCIHCLKVKND